MTIHFNTAPVHSGICVKRTNLAELRALVAALAAATLAWFCVPVTWVSPPTRRALAASMRT